MNKNRCLSIAGAVTLLFLSACSSVNQPSASLSLVSDHFPLTKSTVSTSVKNRLDSTEANMTVSINGLQYRLTPAYHSAAGALCKRGINSMHQLVFCKQDDGEWYQLEGVVLNAKLIDPIPNLNPNSMPDGYSIPSEALAHTSLFTSNKVGEESV